VWRLGLAGIIEGMDRNMSVGSGERLLEELVRAAQPASPAELPVVLNRYAESMGLGRADIYLVDIQQRLLVPLVEGEPELELDAAGWAYRASQAQSARSALPNRTA
jgi:hypothetical protein